MTLCTMNTIPATLHARSGNNVPFWVPATDPGFLTMNVATGLRMRCAHTQTQICAIQTLFRFVLGSWRPDGFRCFPVDGMCFAFDGSSRRPNVPKQFKPIAHITYFRFRLHVQVGCTQLSTQEMPGRFSTWQLQT